MIRSAPARQDAMRRHNLALVLQQIHLDGALTRAELTQRLGLSRSTIGDLVAELSTLGLLGESVPSGGPRVGRPSHVVGPRPHSPFVVAVDIDVNRIVAAAIGVGGRVLARQVLTTRPGPASPEEVTQEIAEAVPALQETVGGGASPVGVGISVPGTVDRLTYVVGLAPNLGWHDAAFGELVQKAIPQLPVSIGNDADLAVLAEHSRGSARGYDDVIYLLGRVGVGAGILVDGRPLRGAGGLAGEVGHTILDPAGPLCHCGAQGCVEMFVGDAALLRLAGSESDPEADVQVVLKAAADGEQSALKAVQSLAESLGFAVANMVNLLNPRLVVMGGSLENVLILAQVQVEAALDQHAMAAARSMVELRTSGLGEDGSLLGAAELAFGPLMADPLSTLAALRVPAGASSG
ncbi:MAG TPA: ROK family transcriptional regulator [Frankiaceae bacterium]|nr:ROK family transcriptional regulator [Frankiaceae bacterium]